MGGAYIYGKKQISSDAPPLFSLLLPTAAGEEGGSRRGQFRDTCQTTFGNSLSSVYGKSPFTRTSAPSLLSPATEEGKEGRWQSGGRALFSPHTYNRAPQYGWTCTQEEEDGARVHVCVLIERGGKEVGEAGLKIRGGCL